MTPTPRSCIRRSPARSGGRASLRHQNADLRLSDLLDERDINRQLLTQLGTCSFVTRQQNVVFRGFTGSGKSYLGRATAKRACEHCICTH